MSVLSATVTTNESGLIRDGRLPVVLNDAIDQLWAKFDRDNGLSMPLRQHLADSAHTAGALWDQWLPASIRRNIVDSVGGEDSDGRLLLQWLAGIHDIGKATPAFQIQIESLAAYCDSAGLKIPSKLADRNSLPHGLAGQLILEKWLTTTHGWSLENARTYATVVGGHHGTYPTFEQLHLQQHSHHLLGEGPWNDAHASLLAEITESLSVAGQLPRWSERPLSSQAQVLLSAAVIVSDWIASDTSLYPYETALGDQRERTEAAWAELNLPRPWVPQPREVSADELMGDRFRLPAGAKSRPVQATAIDVARNLKTPGLIIIEAPMGVGKTEAALLAAEVLAAGTGAGGLIFALPSMATSDAMFGRIHQWIEHLPRDPAAPTLPVFLAHGKAQLNDEYRGIADAQRFADIDSDRGAAKEHTDVFVHEWLSGRKKGVLASFVVGTIDQVLFAALKSKHLVLRHLGLAGKVVVIDEVHAADEYMSVYLDRTLEWLGAYGVPTILLSATLPGKRRRAMVEAYDRGRGRHEPPRLVRWRPGDPETAAEKSPYEYLQTLTAYPLITATDSAAPVVASVEACSRSTDIQVEPLDDDLETLRAFLSSRLAGGGCAVVIRNTVNRAQETYEHLKSIFGDEVTLAHSRFIATDRIKNEVLLREKFGPPDASGNRPYRHILVATQVVEQSLDVDFDLMVTDIAPIDLVLQRAGRLHRHERGPNESNRPLGVREATLCITGVDWQSPVASVDRGAKAVYGADSLLKSLAVLDTSTRPMLHLPADIPRLVQSAYGDSCPVPSGWAEDMELAEEKANQRRQQRKSNANTWLVGSPQAGNLVGWTQGGVGNAGDEVRGHASVRDGQESLEVLVVQRRDDGLIYRWRAPEGESAIATDFEPDLRLARKVSANTLRLPPRLTMPWSIDRTISDLEDNFFPGWQSSKWLREQLVLVLDRNCQALLTDFQLTYSGEVGLAATPREV